MNNTNKLDSFDATERRETLETLASNSLLPNSADSNIRINMHQHSFFSYNADGYSPSHIAWNSRQAGFYAAGLCDFDVLDGLEEFLAAGFLLGLRSTVNVETRAFLKEFSGVDINSPGEPGVTYIMGAGFTSVPDPDSPQHAMLALLRDKAGDRNLALTGRINAALPDIAVDYRREVEPLSPGGCPTERHIIKAYADKTRSVFNDPEKLNAFVANLFGVSAQEAARMVDNKGGFEEKLRSKLAKNGGLGYEKPTEKTFPLVDDFVKWVLDCGAVPMIAWLDGTTAGESDAAAMVECMAAKGVCAINIIPDRNHNISDAKQRKIKLEKLDEIMKIARGSSMPVNIGTEMNKAGQPFADDLDCEALAPYKDDFISGARVLVGHTLLNRFAGYSYTGPGAAAEFGRDVQSKNRFFESVGALPPLVSEKAAALVKKGQEKALACFRDSAKAGSWQL